MALSDEKYIRFTTFRRDGTAVPTPVWVVKLDDTSVGFWTSSGSGKAKRLANNARVTVQPCNARGVPTTGTTPLEATARLVTGAEFAQIQQKVREKYGAMTKVTKALGTLGGIMKGRRIPYGDRGVVISLPS
jgi:PPOX class probable F420-dependent enzyme